MQDKRELKATLILPEDSHSAVLIGRVWSKAENGPCPVLVKNGHVHDLSSLSATVSGLLERRSLISELENTESYQTSVLWMIIFPVIAGSCSLP